MKIVKLIMAACAALTLAVPQQASSWVAPPPAAAPPEYPVVSGLDGDWDGALEAGTEKLRLIFHVVTSPRTGTIATLDSIDQGATGLPVAAVTRVGNRVTFDVAIAQGSFEGTLSSDGQTIAGTWRQLENVIPLTLTRRALAAAPTKS